MTIKIWVVESNYGDDHQSTDSAWMDRGDAFNRYRAIVSERFSTNAAEITANDYAPGQNLSYEDRYGNSVELTAMDVHEKGEW